jgi:hypothetical protein
MNNLFSKLTSIFKPAELLAPGIYHYQSPPTEENQYRLHLRVDDQGEGLLIINAATILHLNQTAAEYAYHLVQGHSPQEAAKAVSSRYHISDEDARRDYLELKGKVLALLEMPDLDPVSFLDISREDPYSGAASAPYRLDCALTYRLPENSLPDLAPVRRVDRELTSQEWLQIIDRAWQAGIPHLIFTGGEPTLREDLVELIREAEKNGQITGLLTDGLALGREQYLLQLLEAGLDHLLFVLSPESKDSWDALQAVVKEDLFTTVHVTITAEISSGLKQIIARCRDLGANAISLSLGKPGDPALQEALANARDLVAEAGLPLKWDLPVPYSQHNPISLELEEEGEKPAGAGKAWYYVEPDGDVLPAQGINQVLGNLLTEQWEQILKRSG